MECLTCSILGACPSLPQKKLPSGGRGTLCCIPCGKLTPFDTYRHMRQLEQAKKAFPDVYLLVGVTGDDETHKRKGLTVLSGKERAETLRHCKWVDEVIENCPWIVTPAFLDEHKIDYVAHDDLPYGAAEGDDIYASIKKEGKFLVTQRTEGVSTTGIITKSAYSQAPHLVCFAVANCQTGSFVTTNNT